MKNPVKIRKPAEDEIDEFLDDSILDLDNCTVDEDFDEIDINSLIDKNILKDLNLRWRLKSRNLSIQRIILPAKGSAAIAW